MKNTNKLGLIFAIGLGASLLSNYLIKKHNEQKEYKKTLDDEGEPSCFIINLSKEDLDEPSELDDVGFMAEKQREESDESENDSSVPEVDFAFNGSDMSTLLSIFYPDIDFSDYNSNELLEELQRLNIDLYGKLPS